MNMRNICCSLSVVTTIILLPLTGRPLHGSELPEQCRRVPVNGSCKAYVKKYYFDQRTHLCEEYISDGCGTVVPFDTIEACRTLCEPTGPAGEGTKKPDVKQRSGLNYDPMEDDPRYAGIFKTIDAEVKESLAADPRYGRRGSVHIYWDTKQRLLKQKYGIDWRSPGELNPQVIFD
jgi:Kunitz/Bovine pancreatic trypsin inhibitor domain